ncbi:MAG: CRTAC1 family protein [Planctomycetes bacterium]|nr:CRTAC1 family protein [Planctomycetota bacterium]MCH8259287.1 CRTAC1 family protein [Planctomycetota bacterium]
MSPSLSHAVGCCLVILWTISGCGKSKPPPPPAPPQATSQDVPWFTEISQQVGLDFHHESGVDDSYFMPQIVGSGAALFDYDADGDLDIYLINSADRLGKTVPAPINRLYRREDDGTYRDVTTASGLGDPGFGMGVAIGDYDNDGYPDVYLANYGPDAFYRNNGDGSFTDVTSQVGVNNNEWACSAAFIDYDLDGYLDVFIVNYLDYPEPKVCTDSAGRPEYCGPSASPPVADVLYRNNGDGSFTDVSASTGIGAIRGRGLGLICEDFNDDGWPDVYITNDGDANFLWLNNGDGTFTESATITGAAFNAFGEAEASMGVTAGDIDDDGDLDLFMTHLRRESNTIYRNDGDAGFMDVTGASGLGTPSMRFTGFGAAFVDLDHDGDLDLVVANGRVKRGVLYDGADPQSTLRDYAEPNLLFLNDGQARFSEAGHLAGALGQRIGVSRGLVVGDIDNDGDLDVLITNCNGPVRLFRNDAPKQGHWLIVRAVDPALRRDAYGARVVVTVGGRKIHRTINPGYSYASSCDPRAHFGLGSAERVEEIVIRWPDGTIERFAGRGADQIVTLSKSLKLDPS